MKCLFDMTDLEIIAACRKAIFHVANRIRNHGEIGHHMGPFTESFALVAKAVAMLEGCTEQEAENYMTGGPPPSQRVEKTEKS
jgi:hypothetical protein